MLCYVMNRERTARRDWSKEKNSPVASGNLDSQDHGLDQESQHHVEWSFE